MAHEGGSLELSTKRTGAKEERRAKMSSSKRYEKISYLGEGQFAVVYKALDKEKNIEVAIKKIKIGNFQEAKDGVNRGALREIKLLQELHHENVISLLDVFGKDSSISLVFSLMETDLEQILNERKVWLSLAHIKAYILMTLKGVEYLHQNFILHRDLKPNNLLLDRHNVLKIADFGLARTFGSPSRKYSHQAVTRWYRSPELLYGSRMYGTGVDIWSVGCILAELFKREPLFPGRTDLDTLDMIVTLLGTPTEANWHGVTELQDFVQFNEVAEGRPFSEHFSALQQDALDILESMLRLSPNERCDATQALAMPYFTTEPYPTPCELLPRFKEPAPAAEATAAAREEKKVPKLRVKLEAKLAAADSDDDEEEDGDSDEADSDEEAVDKSRQRLGGVKLEPVEAEAVPLETKPTKAKRLKFDE